MKRALITGGAGFIGSNLADRLVADGVEVVVYDNFSHRPPRVRRGALRRHGRRRSSRATCSTRSCFDTALEGCDTVFHLAANADVRHGLEHPRRDLEQNTIATSTVLEAMRAAGVDADRLRVDRLGLRRAGGLPDAGDLPVPGPDLALRRVEARRRGADRGLLPRATASRA